MDRCALGVAGITRQFARLCGGMRGRFEKLTIGGVGA